MPLPRAFQCSRAMGAVMGHGLCSQGLVSCPGACLPVLTAPWPRVVPGGPQSPSSALGRGGLPASLCSAFQCPRHQLQGTHISHTAPKPRHHRWAVRYINKLRLSQEEQSSLFFFCPQHLLEHLRGVLVSSADLEGVHRSFLAICSCKTRVKHRGQSLVWILVCRPYHWVNYVKSNWWRESQKNKLKQGPIRLVVNLPVCSQFVTSDTTRVPWL